MDYFEESPEKISFVFDSMTDNQLEIVFLNRLPEPIHLQNGEKKTSIFYFGIAQDMEQLNPYFNCEAYNGNNSVYVLDDNGSKLFNSNQVEPIKGHNVFSVLQNIHQPAGNWLAGYRMLEKAYRDGKAKSIGISNFEGKYMEELKTKWEIVPQFIQVEAHPYFTQKELRITLDKYGIKLMSWYPLGHGDTALMNEQVFAELGKKYGKTPAQIILRWHTQMGFVVIPGSKNADHIKDNMDIFDFKLTDNEMEQIAKLDKNERLLTVKYKL